METACFNENLDIVRKLLKCDNNDINHIDNSGCTAFYRACQKGNIEIVRNIISYSVDINTINTVGLSPSQAAVKFNHVEVVKELLKCDIFDIDYSDYSGRTVFYRACQKGNVDIVVNFLDHDVDIKMSDPPPPP